MFQSIELFGRTINLANLFINLGDIGTILWLLFNLNFCKDISTFPQLAEEKIGKGKKKSIGWIAVLLEIVVIFVIVNVILSGYFRRLLSIVFLHDLSANFFLNIFALPLEILIIGAILKISPLKLSDLVAPGMSFALICYKIACFCDGCCYGVATEKYGLMNQWTNRKDFPIQLVECGCAIIMFVILVILFRKKERKDGTLYPIFMLMYCASRFVSEFWRDDYPNVLGLLKSYHIQCIIGFVEGAILLFVALKWGEKISDYYATKKQELLERFRSKSSNKNDTQE